MFFGAEGVVKQPAQYHGNRKAEEKHGVDKSKLRIGQIKLLAKLWQNPGSN